MQLTLNEFFEFDSGGNAQTFRHIMYLILPNLNYNSELEVLYKH
jgi:hypothetical protein